jgi:hypothetical protein
MGRQLRPIWLTSALIWNWTAVPTMVPSPVAIAPRDRLDPGLVIDNCLA